MFKRKLLHIELLKYLLQKSNCFGYVEIRDFLLEHFPEETDLKERIKMKDFLSFLNSEEYIEILAKKGIWIIQEAGVIVDRKDVSAIIKIKPKGVNLVEQSQINNYNKIGIILSSIFGLSTILLGIYSINISQNISDLEMKINDLNKENIILKSTNEIQGNELKKKFEKEITPTNNKTK